VPVAPVEAAAGLTVRDLQAGDEAGWRVLWKGYNRFYATELPDAVTARTWRRLLDPHSPVIGRAAERDGQVAGFSHSVLHESTWRAAPVCYLEDLFVDPASRGGGIGRALMDDLVALGRQRGWSRLYWHTRTDNAVARRLYDSFATADGFVRYRLELG